MSQLAVGEYLEDRYRIDRPIARGGMSTVYRCVDERLGREVAAKVMDERYVDDAVFLDRFRREARAMAQLTHPNLVGVYDFSAQGDTVFLIMELITGGTLRELLAERGPMPPHAATAVMRATLTGLSVAHAKGMVHRDIKPDNILINGDHRVKLADFGLVRAASDAQHSTDQIVGTVAYLSPEQVDGSEITQASDVYSAGVVLFELLTGTTPFSGDSQLAHAFARIHDDVPAPSTRISGVPKLFDELVATATARDPKDRFNDAGDFLAALDDVAAELQLPAYTVPVPTNSAAHRAAAIPTDMTSPLSTQPPTGDSVDSSANETSVLSPHAEQETSFETAVVPPVAAPTPPAYREPETQMQPAVPPVEADSHAVPAEYQRADVAVDQPKPETNRSVWSLILWLIVIFALTAAVAVGAWWFGSGRYGEIPQVIGMGREEAITAVTEAGFEPATEIVYSNTVPADSPVGTEPPAGDKVLPGDQVKILISQGRPTVPEVPGGMSVEDYRAIAEERTFQVITGESVYSTDAPVGSVASTEPAAGTALDIGSKVTVAVSKGPEPIEVPDLRGLPKDDAVRQLEEAGLNVGEITEDFDEDIYGGNVVSSDPGKTTQLERGDTVNLVLSNAKTMPDVTGMTLDDATEALDAAGITLDNTQRDKEAVGENGNVIVSSDPVPWTNLKPEEAEASLVLPGKVTVPDVTGMTVADARELLEDIGLKINRGSRYDKQTITAQKTAAGSPLTVGQTVKVDSK
ncbi:Stk1 family PASTA domain-containing Ser/Thr kinase [Corynebacterium breve]|uniref:non-specific serine/threonine protein kinase n=1 Tax=Corynebacterium breve TaxID=3049799 RepID=A0ABY8VBD7_9CORY|nr:Stk1 family PASTA domain-containing Ser/Thr kinase [Corynebacterium breve]WIM66986.1 Stk1 family PASTA domain-containing Ser/Thr kinase [Corynebacterium breve]